MTMPPPSEPPKGHPLTRPMFFVAGLFFVGVGIVGYVLPVMPGTIFLIIAAGCFARSSSRLETWLLNHPQLGPSVKAWRTNGAIPRRIKVIAITSMVVSFGLLCFAHIPEVWMAAAGVVLLACAIFVGTRPEGPKEAR